MDPPAGAKACRRERFGASAARLQLRSGAFSPTGAGDMLTRPRSAVTFRMERDAQARRDRQRKGGGEGAPALGTDARTGIGARATRPDAGGRWRLAMWRRSCGVASPAAASITGMATGTVRTEGARNGAWGAICHALPAECNGGVVRVGSRRERGGSEHRGGYATAGLFPCFPGFHRGPAFMPIVLGVLGHVGAGLAPALAPRRATVPRSAVGVVCSRCVASRWPRPRSRPPPPFCRSTTTGGVRAVSLALRESPRMVTARGRHGGPERSRPG